MFPKPAQDQCSELQAPQETSQLFEVMEMAEIQQMLGGVSAFFPNGVWGPAHVVFSRRPDNYQIVFYGWNSFITFLPQKTLRALVFYDCFYILLS